MADRSDGRDFERLYANHLEVGFNAYEFLLDFGTRSPESDQTRFHAGFMTSPGCAEAFFETLRKALEKYEESHGPIPKVESPAEEIP